MTVKLKPVPEQTIVITGASSGIGLTTARMAAKRGAKLVLAARSTDALETLADEINASGSEALAVTVDVSREEDVRRIAEQAIERFGGFDTWINNAGVSIYGKLADVPVDDMRRQFDTNVWGLVYGTLEAAKHLRQHGGALINLGSTLSDRTIPLQGSYCASKHAVKAFTDALRMELEADGAPVSVTLIKPAAIDTPYSEHGKNYLASAPQNPPPVYAPETVARAILHCAEHPERDVFVGAGAKAFSALGYYAPRAIDKAMKATLFDIQTGDRAAGPRDHNGLDHASGTLKERGDYPGHVAESSVYTRASLHPVLTAALAFGAGLGVMALGRASRTP